jgi:hypothetical protein
LSCSDQCHQCRSVVSIAFPIPAMSRDDGDLGDPGTPRHPSHPIPVIPFWRGFQRFLTNRRKPFPDQCHQCRSVVSTAFPIPAMSRDDGDLGDPGTQCHPTPGKPGFGFLGWKRSPLAFVLASCQLLRCQRPLHGCLGSSVFINSMKAFAVLIFQLLNYQITQLLIFFK